MFSEMLKRLLHLVQGESDDLLVLNDIKRLLEDLIDLELSINDSDGENYYSALADTRKAVSNVRPQLGAQLDDIIDASELKDMLNELSHEDSLKKEVVCDYKNFVERSYISLQEYKTRKNQSRKYWLRVVGALGLIPFVVWLAYMSWIYLWNSYEVVSNDIEWPAEAYELKTPWGHSYNYTDAFNEKSLKMLSACYFKKECPKHYSVNNPYTFKANDNFFKFHQKGLKYKDTKRDLFGVVFRTIIRNRRKESVPINHSTLSVKQIEAHEKGFWINDETMPDVSSKVDIEFTGEKFIVHPTRPIVNLKGIITYKSKNLSSGESNIVSINKDTFVAIDSARLINQYLIGHKKVEAYAGGEIKGGPLYVSVDHAKISNLPVVSLDLRTNYILKESDIAHDDRHDIQKCYYVKSVSDLSKVVDLQEVSNMKINLNYNWLDNTSHSISKEFNNTWYMYKEKDLPLCGSQSEVAYGNAADWHELISSIAGISTLSAAAKGESEIELWCGMNLQEGPNKTFYLNEVLASGGILDVFSHIDGLESGRYNVQFSVNGFQVNDFDIQYINPTNEHFEPDDIYKIWRVSERPKTIAAKAADKFLEEFIRRGGKNIPAKWLKDITHGDLVSFRFADIQVSSLLDLLNQFIGRSEDPQIIVYPKSSDTMPIWVKDMPWFNVVLLIAERQGWRVKIVGDEIKLFVNKGD